VTERQQRIIALVRAGRTNPEIATEIGFSVPTIKSELARLCALMGATNRADLATKAERAGF
jgi:DNA-binding NarL/FixJ family response regulator